MNIPKILFIVHLPPPLHGAAVMGQYLYDSKRIRSNYLCKFINLSTSEDLNELGKGSLKKAITLLKILLNVMKEKLIFNPDVCYLTINAIGPAFYKDMFVVLLLKLFNSKFIYHFHTKGIANRQDRILDNVLYKILFKNSFCILLSSLLYPDIQKYVPVHHVAFCANGIQDCNYKRLVIKENSRCQLLFLSHMMKEKGVFILLEACNILKSRDRDFDCSFVGPWYNISEWQFDLRVKELDLNLNVRAFGGQYGQDKEKFFVNGDIFIFPTYYCKETFGLVNLEAMQYGLPVISTHEGAIPEIVEDGVTGYLVNKMDSIDLANKIEALIMNPLLREKMGMAGREKYENKFTLLRWEKRLNDIIDQVIIGSTKRNKT